MPDDIGCFHLKCNASKRVIVIGNAMRRGKREYVKTTGKLETKRSRIRPSEIMLDSKVYSLEIAH